MRAVILLLWWCTPLVLWGQTVPVTGFISGRVLDERQTPLPYANVSLQGTLDGDVTDRSGYFLIKTRHVGKQTLLVTMMGYEPEKRTVRVPANDTVFVTIRLAETLIMLEEAVVTASAFSTGDDEGVTLKSLEVVTTPGAAADIFRAIKSFPGVATLDEGSGLFVRGGNVTETVTLLDQATVVHPYKYETPTGGIFGTISPFLVRGTFFSSGGFSARYGNALSGVLAMESQDMPDRKEYFVGIGLAAASAAWHTTLFQDRIGLRFSGNRSFTDMLFRLNGQRDDFVLTPRSTDGNLSLIWKYSPTGKLKVFNFVNFDRVGVRLDQPSFEGRYLGRELNQLHNLQWIEIIRNWLIKSSLSLNRFKATKALGNFTMDSEDETYKWRTDVEREMHRRGKLYFGFEIEKTYNRFQGKVPLVRDVLDPQAETLALNESFAAIRLGAYAETEARLHRRWFVNVGMRTDYFSLARQQVVDPRISLRFQAGKSLNVRFSWGIYHQFPQPYEYNQVKGNPNLKAQQAEHYVGVLEYEKNHTLFRIESYYKPYRRLVIETNGSNLENRGYGYARGVDLFLKYGAYLLTRFNGWISYSFLQSRRLLARNLAGVYRHEEGPSPWDITHNLTVVGKVRVYRYLSLGLAYRYATGRPVTPVQSAVRQLPHDYYLPIEGPVNSERLPSFQKLDLTLSYFMPFGYGNNAVFYFSVSNLLNRANVLDYEYNRDYSQRQPRITSYRRFVYFGVSIAFVTN